MKDQVVLDDGSDVDVRLSNVETALVILETTFSIQNFHFGLEEAFSLKLTALGSYTMIINPHLYPSPFPPSILPSGNDTRIIRIRLKRTQDFSVNR